MWGVEEDPPMSKSVEGWDWVNGGGGGTLERPPNVGRLAPPHLPHRPYQILPPYLELPLSLTQGARPAL